MVKLVQGTAKDKADVFQALSVYINLETKGSWQASRWNGTDGSHVFIGKAGEVLVIDPTGALFRGRIQNIDIVSSASCTPRYNQLHLIP